MSAGDDDSNGWQLTESDPGVFTELLKTLGVPLMVDDLYSLDEYTLADMKPSALIFLFKWLPTHNVTSDPSTAGSYDPDFPGFFAHQVVNNACATLAVLNALGNIPSLESGQQLSDLFSFSAGMDAQTRGLVITSSDWLREAHNALSPPSAISLDGLGLPKKQAEDAYHFVVYLPAMGSVYELDGLREHPVSHGAYETSGEGWLKKARETIEHRIATYPPGSLDFSLLAVREDPLPSLRAQLTAGTGDQTEISGQIYAEESKRERWAFENSLRRHNHVGLVHALITAMASAGTLGSAREKAKTVMKERIERARARGENMDED